jgi:cephalosporin-C deacetylase
MNKKLSLLSFLILFAFQIFAQPARQLVQVVVTPDKADWTYAIGDRAEFAIQVLRNNVPLDGIEVNYNIQPEQMKAVDEGKLTLKKGTASVKAPKMKDPGFLRCNVSVEVDGKTYSSYATAGFDPDKIEPTTTLPATIFRNSGKRENRIWPKWK